MTRRPATITTLRKSTNQKEKNKEAKDKAIENIASKKDCDEFLKFCLTSEKAELSEISCMIDCIEIHDTISDKEQQTKKALYQQYHKLKKEILRIKNSITKNKEEIEELEKVWRISSENITPKGPYTNKINKNED